MAPAAEPRDFIAATFRAWREAGLSALVLRNYQELPADSSNDIDVLLPRGERAAAEALLIQVAERSGFRLHNRAEYATRALSFHSLAARQVHFDLFTGLFWRGLPFLDVSAVLRGCKREALFDIPNPVHEAAINLLSGLLHAGVAKPKYRAGAQAAAGQFAGDFLRCVAWGLGDGMAGRLTDSVQRGDWAAVESLAPRLRRALIWRHLWRHPWRCVADVARDAGRLAGRFLQPPGLVLVLCGPDGCGKSTAGEGLARALERSFPQNKGLRIHWKPAVFTRRRQAARAPSTDPHGRPARGRLVSSLFLVFHWLEFLLGWYLRVRPVLFRGGLVLIDRWYYDFFVDQRRYRLNAPMTLVRLGGALLPRPHRVCLLDAPVEVLRQRKQEVPAAETARQRAAFLDLMRRLPNGRVIDAERPVEEVVQALTLEALAASAERLAGVERPRRA